MSQLFFPLKGFESFYEISKTGIVRSKDRRVKSSHGAMRVIPGKNIRPDLSNKGYYRIPLSINGIVRAKFGLHRLLAINFIPNPDNLPCINHKDANPLNNELLNLEWCTQSYNIQYKFDNGYIHHRRTLSDEAVIDIYTTGKVGSFRGVPRIKGNIKELSKKHNTTNTVIMGILNNKTYLNITKKIKR